MIFKDVIEFACHENLYGAIPEPKPANKFLPEWYKKIKPYCGRDKLKFPIRTVKKCMPVLDAMSLGYIIPLPTDIHFITNHDLSYIKGTVRTGEGQFGTPERHEFRQIESQKWPINNQDPIKLINPWYIKTKPGWSCYITAPVNHFGCPFTIMSGVVDTDKYQSLIQFPAIWNIPNFDDTLLAGMPMAQVIPFKRNKQDVVCRALTEKESKNIEKTNIMLGSRADCYKNSIRAER